jgi:hypothetical protein
MINNLEQIKSLLKFENENEFYFVQVIQRSKENPDLGKNNNLVKAYYVYSLEYLDKKFPEMVKLAEVFNARIYIHLNRRNAYNIALELMEDLAHNIRGNHLKTLDKSYSSVCGKHHSEKDKTWIIDVDNIDAENAGIIIQRYVTEILEFVDTLEPIGNKDVCVLETKNGYHLITRPFNSQKFSEVYPDIQIHKNNPTILYIP